MSITVAGWVLEGQEVSSGLRCTAIVEANGALPRVDGLTRRDVRDGCTRLVLTCKVSQFACVATLLSW